jgi:hypothetical protein
MISLASTLPENSNDGYVAAAYIVFFALVLIYVAIMAIRLARVERSVRELREAARRGEQAGTRQGELQDSERPEGTRREREPV